MRVYEDLQDSADHGGHVKLFEKLLVDLAEAEGMPPDMVDDLRNEFNLNDE